MTHRWQYRRAPPFPLPLLSAGFSVWRKQPGQGRSRERGGAAAILPSLGHSPGRQVVTPMNSYVYNNFRAKIIGRIIFQSILLNNNKLIIINNTNEKNCCYFPIEYRSGNIIYCNKTLKIVVCDVTFCFFNNLDVTSLK